MPPRPGPRAGLGWAARTRELVIVHNTSSNNSNSSSNNKSNINLARASGSASGWRNRVTPRRTMPHGAARSYAYRAKRGAARLDATRTPRGEPTGTGDGLAKGPGSSGAPRSFDPVDRQQLPSERTSRPGLPFTPFDRQPPPRASSCAANDPTGQR